MRIYNFKYHMIFSAIISCIVGVGAFFILKPYQFNTVEGVIESLDSSYTHTQVAYGYNSLFTIFIIAFLILLVLYKPVKKVIDKQIKIKNQGG